MRSHQSGIRRSESTLDDTAWRALIHALGGDEVYAQLHHRLSTFFRWRGARDPDGLADVSLDRLGRRVAAGEVTGQPSRFALGVARMVWLEQGRAELRRAELDDTHTAPGPAEDPQAPHLAALEQCLSELGADDRALVLQYYAASTGRARIDGRQALAASLAVTLNSLRVRAFRLRQRLEACVARHVGRGGA